MLKVSKLADYAVVTLVALAQNSEDIMSTSALSEITNLPEPTVSKVLKSLAKGKIITSTRGINGGYTLARAPEVISVEEIIRTIDGPVSIIACVGGSEPDCNLSDCCSVRGRWDEVNTVIRDALLSMTLSKMLDNRESHCAVRSLETERCCGH